MGEAKRRKKLDPNYGKPQTLDFGYFLQNKQMLSEITIVAKLAENSAYFIDFSKEKGGVYWMELIKGDFVAAIFLTNKQYETYLSMFENSYCVAATIRIDCTKQFDEKIIPFSLVSEIVPGTQREYNILMRSHQFKENIDLANNLIARR